MLDIFIVRVPHPIRSHPAASRPRLSPNTKTNIHLKSNAPQNLQPEEVHASHKVPRHPTRPERTPMSPPHSAFHSNASRRIDSTIYIESHGPLHEPHGGLFGSTAGSPSTGSHHENTRARGQLPPVPEPPVGEVGRFERRHKKPKPRRSQLMQIEPRDRVRAVAAATVAVAGGGCFASACGKSYIPSRYESVCVKGE